MRWLLQLSVGLILAGSGVSAEGTDGNAEELEKLKTQVLAIAQSAGEDYIKGRVGLEEMYRKNAKTFEELERSDDWRVSLMCGIVAEYVNKAEAIQRFINLQMEIPYDSALSRWVHNIGEALAKEGKDVPMLLVESIWKGNEVKKIRYDIVNIPGVIIALGMLNVKQSRGLLEAIITNNNFFDDHISGNSLAEIHKKYGQITGKAAYVLGNFSDPRSVQTLIKALELNRTIPDSYAGNAIAEAILSCVDTNTIHLLKEACSTTDEKTKGTLNRLILYKEKGIKSW